MYSTSSLPLPCQRNHVLSHSANAASAQRRRKQNSSCHLLTSPPVQTSKPPQRLVIKSPAFTGLCKEIKPLSLLRPCLYLDKQMTTCSETVQHLNKGAWEGWAYLSHWTPSGWPCTYLPAHLDIRRHTDIHAHKGTKLYTCASAHTDAWVCICLWQTPMHTHTHHLAWSD